MRDEKIEIIGAAFRLRWTLYHSTCYIIDPGLGFGLIPYTAVPGYRIENNMLVVTVQVIISVIRIQTLQTPRSME